ncbi:MAG: polyamine aminopropyltransferase, partial [Hyphomicrobiales bacterium]
APVSAGAYDDPRLDLVVGDGAEYVKSAKTVFDVIIVDATDPIGPGAALFTAEFYADCASALRPGGVLVTQNGVPFMQPGELKATMAAFKAIFTDRTAYLATIPTYVGGPMAFGWGCHDPALRQPGSLYLERCFAEVELAMQYYSPAVHMAAFALPPYIGKIVEGA